MATTELTVNGRRVFSDKTLQSVVGTFVRFADGSTCDFTIGSINNRGPGYISFDTPSPSNTEDREMSGEPQSFTASAVQVRDVPVIDIQPYDGREVVVTLSGRESMLKDINVRQRGDMVVIEGKGTAGDGTVIRLGHGPISVSGSLVGGVISAGNIVVAGGGSRVNITTSDRPSLKATVKVPKGTKLDLSGVFDTATVGDTEGPLQVALQGGGDLNVGSVTDTVLSLQGGGDITIKEVNGNTLTVSLQGSGDVSVEGGKVNALSVTIQGSGGVTFDGHADNANLSVMGSGDIKIARVTNTPVKRCLGSGSINVQKTG